MIRGIISGEAIAAYENEWGEKITSNTKGGIISIKKFEIVMGQVPADRPEIYLYIKEMVMVGCEGTGTFGQPNDIVRDKIIKELTQRCWKNSEHNDYDPSDKGESLDDSSQPSQDSFSHSLAVNNGNTLSTQLGLSSQAPPSYAARKPEITQGPTKTATLNSRSNQLLDALKSKSATAVTARREYNGSPSSRSVHKPQIEATTAAEAEFDAEISNDHSRISPGNLKTVQTPPNITRVNQKTASNCNGGIPGPVPNDVNSTRDSNNTSVCNVPLGMPEERPTPSNQMPSPGKQGAFVRKKPKNRTRDKSSFSGWGRIRRHDVLIPEDQQDLIDGPDSWVPPETGQRVPHGRVPIKLLRQWDRMSCKTNVEDSLPVHDTHASSCNNSEHEGQRTPTTSLLPESGLMSSEWPLSPNRPADSIVPPDSSPPRFSHKFPRGTAQTFQVDGSPLSTRCLGPPTAAADISEDSGEEFDMEFSALKGLDTSTQEQQINTQSQPQTQAQMQTQLDDDTPNPDLPIITVNTNSLARAIQPLSQQLGKSIGPENHTSAAAAPSNPKRKSSGILVPATYETSKSKTQPRKSITSELEPTHVTTHNSTHVSSLGDSSYLGRTEQSVWAPQTPFGKNNITSSNADDTPITVNVPRSSLDTSEEATQSSAASPSKIVSTPHITRKRKSTQLESIRPRPSKLQKVVVPEPFGASNAITEHRQVYFEESPDFSRAREIFNKFKQAYPSYQGDSWIFRNSCSKLQCLRDQGLMQQSFLWDDFVAREVSDYREYAMNCHEKGIPPDRYDRYFKTQVKASRYKKRSLTDKNIKFIATGFAVEYKVPLKSSQAQSKRTLIVEESPPPTFEEDGTDELMKGGPMSDDNQSEDEFYDAHEAASEVLGSEDDFPMPRVRSTGAAGRRENKVDHKDIPSTTKDSAGLVEKSGEPVKQWLNSHQNAVLLRGNLDPMSENNNAPMNHPAEKVRNKPVHRQILPMYPPSKDPGQKTQDSSPKISEADPSSSSSSTSPSSWWKQPNTPFKSFAKNYVNLFSELGYRRKNLVDQVVPADEDGVIKVEQPESGKQGGKMKSMGFKCPWT